jgi:hypothetical protein
MPHGDGDGLALVLVSVLEPVLVLVLVPDPVSVPVPVLVPVFVLVMTCTRQTSIGTLAAPLAHAPPPGRDVHPFGPAHQQVSLRFWTAT